uniref:Glycosyltransferase n=1 Tax=viral metagenome TaxID=1070528 RepID=A0A6C0BBM1_9ZZZZ
MKVAYLINTTPKYFYLLPLHIGLIHRYAPGLDWDLWIATEEPNHYVINDMKREGVKILELLPSESGFLKSREAALRRLPSYDYVIPAQEDFLLERFIDYKIIDQAFAILEKDRNVQSIRWMPCPGPAPADEQYGLYWQELDPKFDEYLFVFQMTVWRASALKKWFTNLTEQFEKDYPVSLSAEERRIAEIRANYAENSRGQGYFKRWMMSAGEKHLAWTRAHKHPNAVYMSPWPYRPTAVVGGKLEAWAVELGKREGWPIRQ